VVVRSGPLADFVGTLERLDSAGRARVLLDHMASVRAVRIAVQNIEAVDCRPPGLDRGGLALRRV